MASTARKILEDALTLPEVEREALVEALSDSLDPTPAHLSPEWQSEIGNRIAQIERGDVEPIPWAAVENRIRVVLERK